MKSWGIILIWIDAISKGDGKNDWMPMVPVKQVLAIWGMIRGVAVAGYVCQPIGKLGKAKKISFFQLILLASLIYLFTIRWDILGTALAVLLSAIVTRIISSYIIIKMIQCIWRSFVAVKLLPLIGTIIMVFSMIFLKSY